MFISVHLFRQFSRMPVCVGTASIPDLTLCRGCISLPISHDLPFARGHESLNPLPREVGKDHYQAFQTFI